jgi:hypothetical protein
MSEPVKAIVDDKSRGVRRRGEKQILGVVL